jgi:hypothetical protein
MGVPQLSGQGHWRSARDDLLQGRRAARPALLRVYRIA